MKKISILDEYTKDKSFSIISCLNNLLDTYAQVRAIEVTQRIMREFKVACRDIESWSQSDKVTPSEWIAEWQGELYVAYRHVPLLSNSGLKDTRYGIVAYGYPQVTIDEITL